MQSLSRVHTIQLEQMRMDMHGKIENKAIKMNRVPFFSLGPNSDIPKNTKKYDEFETRLIR